MERTDDPDKYVNLFLPDGSWRGFFYSKDAAADWLLKAGYSLAECEISKRRPDLSSK